MPIRELVLQKHMVFMIVLPCWFRFYRVFPENPRFFFPENPPVFLENPRCFFWLRQRPGEGRSEGLHARVQVGARRTNHRRHGEERGRSGVALVVVGLEGFWGF